jgi:polar amino acid transport system substrate-binding protein
MKAYFLIFSLLFTTWQLFSQTASDFVVGVRHDPPFIIKESDGSFSGLSVDLWTQIAEEQEISYQFKEYKDKLGLIRALDFNEIDICIDPMHANEIRMKMLEVTQPFYVSYIGVATTHVKKTQLGAFLKNFFSLRFFRLIFILIIIIFFFGTILWMVERKENRRQFRPGLIGIFDGLWWSAVTMTTVGYGDKAPKTRMGRLIAIVWMLTAIVTISGFTGSIASSLTVQSLGRTIEDTEDLRNSKSLGSVISSSSETYLKRNKIKANVLYNDVRESLLALSAQEFEVLVYDKSVLDYYIGNMQLNNKVVLLPVSFNQQYLSYLLPKNSPNLKWINTLLVRSINDASWHEKMKKYNIKKE